MVSAAGPAKAPQPAVTRVSAQDDRELPRQGSLVDGEGIKIVIHDVDSELSKSHPYLQIALNNNRLCLLSNLNFF